MGFGGDFGISGIQVRISLVLYCWGDLCRRRSLLSSHRYKCVKIGGISFIIYKNNNVSGLLHISIEEPCQCLVKGKEKYSSVCRD